MFESGAVAVLCKCNDKHVPVQSQFAIFCHLPVSLLSTGPLASYCTFINEIILCYVIFYDANKLVIYSFIQIYLEQQSLNQRSPV